MTNRILALAISIIWCLAPQFASTDEGDFIGTWMLMVDQGRGEGKGLLELRASDGGLVGHVEGGPIAVRVEGDRIEMDVDGLSAGGGVIVRRLKGSRDGDSMGGEFGPDEPSEVCRKFPLSCPEPSGIWSAERVDNTARETHAPQPVALSGIWRSIPGGGMNKYSMDLTPKAQAWVDNFDLDLDLPAQRCVRAGLVTRFPTSTLEVLTDENRLTFLYGGGQVRRIYLDGRRPSESDLHTAMGYSVGWWDGSTLVVETTRLRRSNIGFRGEPISENARVVERYTLSEDGTSLSGGLTLHDPENYRKPPLRRKLWKRDPEAQMPPALGCDPDSFFRHLHVTGKMQEYIDRSDRRY